MYCHAHGENMTQVLDAPLLLPLLDSVHDGGDPIALGEDFALRGGHFDEDGGAGTRDERRQVVDRRRGARRVFASRIDRAGGFLYCVACQKVAGA